MRQSSKCRPWEFPTSTLSPGCKIVRWHTEVHQGSVLRQEVRRWREVLLDTDRRMSLCTRNSTTGMVHFDKARGSTVYQFQYQLAHELFHLRNQFLYRLCTHSPDPYGFHPMTSLFPLP